jgi:hypothetical protein
MAMKLTTATTHAQWIRLVGKRLSAAASVTRALCRNGVVHA